jgi:hypothetical protein
MNFIRETHTQIISTAFLSALGEAASSELETQVLLDPQGQSVTDYVSIRARKRILVRGNHKSIARKCSTCRRQLYSARGRRYVLQDDVAEGDLFESLTGLVLSETLYQSVVTQIKLRRVGILKLSVQQAPRDGLGVDPHDRVMEFQRDAKGEWFSYLVDKT